MPTQLTCDGDGNTAAGKAPFLQKRRFVLSALIISPLLLYSYSGRWQSRLPEMAAGNFDDFVIINGWVMLKQDIAE